jgi:acyl carrier protein
MGKNLTNEEIRLTIERTVAEISRVDVREFEDEVIIRDELGIDSLMAMEIIATCEKRLDIHIDEAAFADIETVGDFLELVINLYRSTHGSA